MVYLPTGNIKFQLNVVYKYINIPYMDGMGYIGILWFDKILTVSFKTSSNAYLTVIFPICICSFVFFQFGIPS